ncbi:MAG: ROK family protein [Christensenella sp.]|nr:ROK family protein [Christensenella sp.]
MVGNKSVTVSEIKRLNRNNIYMLLKNRGDLSKQDIVGALKLSLPTVTVYLNYLLEKGLACESGTCSTGVGRKACTYSINKNARIAIGIDVTKNHITIVSVNMVGEILSRLSLRKRFELKDSYYQYVGELVKAEIKKNGFSQEQILGVGIGIPGLATDDGTEIFYGKTLTDFSGLKITAFNKYIEYPCVFIKDANAACLAETWSNPQMSNVFYISLSNYVGGSVRLYDKPYSGEGPRSGEVGHITIVPNGLQCYCGQKGCTDPYCSALRLSEQEDENLEQFFRKLKKGDAECQKRFDEYLYYLSLAVNNTRMLFDCKIILGGYVGVYLEEYLDQLKMLLKKRNPFEDNADYVQVCKWKNDPIAAGAAILFIDQFEKSI